MGRFSCCSLALALLASGCTNGEPITDAGTACGAHLTPYETACVPVLDDCPTSQVPIPGGGCKEIGVEECAVHGRSGLKRPPDWTCLAVGAPPLPACKAGWTHNAGGGCEPILPPARCPDGTIAEIGEVTCQPRSMGDCGTGTYGKIKLDPDTIFVDQSYQGADADGSQSKPFPTISAAVGAAPAGARIAVAAGAYADVLTLSKTLTIEGRCPQLVSVASPFPAWLPAVTIDAYGVTLRGITVTGLTDGITIYGAAGVTIQEVVVKETAGIGIDIAGSQATLEDVTVSGPKSHGLHLYKSAGVLRRVLISQATGWATFLQGSQVTVDRSVVRETRPVATATQGDGIFACAVDGAPSTVTIQDSLFLDNFGVGVMVLDSDATVERSVVRGSQQDGPVDQVWKAGIKAHGSAAPPSLLVRDCLLAENRALSFDLKDVDATIERTTVRDTLPLTWGEHKGLGRGVVMTGEHGNLTLRDSLVDGSRGSGVVVVQGARGTIERTIVTNTQALDSGAGGAGVYVGLENGQPAALSIRDSLVQGNRMAGLLVLHSAVQVERSVIRDTQIQQSNGAWGAGIAAARLDETPTGASPSKVSVDDSILLDNRMSGIYADDGSVTVTGSLIKGTRPSNLPGLPAMAVWVVGQTSLEVHGSTVTDNWDNGILLSSASATIEESVVRRTRASSSFVWGAGITATLSYNPTQGKLEPPSSLTLRDAAVDESASVGVVLIHSSGILERVAVRRTVLATDSTGWTAAVGIYVGAGDLPPGIPAPTAPATLVLEDSLVEESSLAGLQLRASTATVKRSIVRSTRDTSVGYGDGIVATNLQLEDSLIDTSARAGLVMDEGGGAVRRSLFRGGVFSIVLENNADPAIDGSNVFEGNQENRITYGESLKPAPPPTLPLPPLPPPPDPGL